MAINIEIEDRDDSDIWRDDPRTRALVSTIKERMTEIEEDHWRGIHIGSLPDMIASIGNRQLCMVLLDTIDELGKGLSIEQYQEPEESVEDEG